MTLADENRSAERGTKVTQVVAHLREGILAGRYAAGQRLIEADLTEELAVSRGSLREAFRRLTAEGLIESVPNRGAIVRRLTRRETIELFEIRRSLEHLAAQRAAENIDQPETRATFEAAIAPIWSDQPRGGLEYIEENRRFHQAVLDASGNWQLSNLSRQLQLPLIMLQQSRALTPTILEDSVREHRNVAAAILAGEPENAGRQMWMHLTRAVDLSKEMPEAIFRPER